MFSNLSSWFYGSNVTEKSDELVIDPCPEDSLIEVDENFEPIEIDESNDWVILGKSNLMNLFLFLNFCFVFKHVLIIIYIFVHIKSELCIYFKNIFFTFIHRMHK